MHLLGALLAAMAWGCASTPSTQILHEDPRGMVSLETVSDPAFDATHPISLDSLTLSRLLRGIYVRDEQRFLQTLMAGKAVPVRVFSDDQADFLAPLITQALSKATPRQIVRFRISDTSGSPPGTTAGSLSAYGLSLYVSLTQYRLPSASPSGTSKPGHQPADPSGLKDRVVLFFPAEARRTDLIEPEGARSGSPSHTVVVDYGLLAGLRPTPVSVSPRPTPSQEIRPSPPPTQAQPPADRTRSGDKAPPPASASEDMRGVEDRLLMQDREIKALREELQSLQQQLSGSSGGRPAQPKAGRSEVPAAAP